MDPIEIVMEGAPIAWKRSGNNKGRYYDQQLKEKEIYRFQIKSQYHGQPLIGSLKLEIEFAIPMPQSWTKSKKCYTISNSHDQKPDLDNLVKFFLDATQEFLFNDDCQIATLIARKYWWHENEGRTVVRIQQHSSLLHEDF